MSCAAGAARDDKGPVYLVAEDRRGVPGPGGRPAAQREVPVRGRGGDRQPAPAGVRQREHAGELAADLVVSADGAMWRPSEPSVVARVQGSGHAGHRRSRAPAPTCTRAGTAGTVANPLHVLAEILASLHRPDGTVAVAGFYDGIPAAERAAAAGDRRGRLRRGGLPPPGSGSARAHGEAGFTTLRASVGTADPGGQRCAGRREVHRDPASRRRARVVPPGPRPGPGPGDRRHRRTCRASCRRRACA